MPAARALVVSAAATVSCTAPLIAATALGESAAALVSDTVPAIEHIAAYRKLRDGSLSPSRRLMLVEEAEKEIRAVHELLGA